MRRRTRKRRKYIRKTKKLNRKHHRHKKQKHHKKTNKQRNKKQKHHRRTKQKHYFRTKQKHHRRTKHQRGGDPPNTQEEKLTPEQEKEKLKKMYCIMFNPQIIQNEDALKSCTLTGNYEKIIMGTGTIQKKTIKLIANFLLDMEKKERDITVSIGETLKYIINDYDLRKALKDYVGDIQSGVGEPTNHDKHLNFWVADTINTQWNKELIKKKNKWILIQDLKYDILSTKDKLEKLKDIIKDKIQKMKDAKAKRSSNETQKLLGIDIEDIIAEVEEDEDVKAYVKADVKAKAELAKAKAEVKAKAAPAEANQEGLFNKLTSAFSRFKKGNETANNSGETTKYLQEIRNPMMKTANPEGVADPTKLVLNFN